MTSTRTSTTLRDLIAAGEVEVIEPGDGPVRYRLTDQGATRARAILEDPAATAPDVRDLDAVECASPGCDATATARVIRPDDGLPRLVCTKCGDHLTTLYGYTWALA